MIATMDKAGRVVIPKSIRDAMGLKPDVSLDLNYVDGRIVVEFAPVNMDVRRKGRFKVLHSEDELPPLTDEMMQEALETVRR